MGVVFLIELAVGIAACLFKADLDDFLHKSLEKSISRSDPDDIAAWDSVQRKLHCCGITGYDDWVELSKKQIRPSCCRQDQIDDQTHDCSNRPANYPDKYYTVCVLKMFTIYLAAKNMKISVLRWPKSLKLNNSSFNNKLQDRSQYVEQFGRCKLYELSFVQNKLLRIVHTELFANLVL